MPTFRLPLFVAIGLLAWLAAAPVAAQKTGKPPKLVAPKEDANTVYDATEEPANPAGGVERFNDYLMDHLTYPTTALQAQVQGTDTVEFIVEKNGTLTNVKLHSPGFDPACDAEALRVVRTAPKWAPARRRGQVVRMRVVLPVTFALPPTPGAAPVPGAGVAGTPAPASAVPPPSGGPAPAGTPAPGGRQVMPESAATYPGGTDAFFAWVKQSIQYPAAAKAQKLEGKIKVEFIIEPDGSLTNAKILNHLGGGLEQEALRLIKVSPKWTAAVYQGKPIRSKMVLPIIFQP